MANKILIVGSNPSTQNDNAEVPFEGTRSHSILEKWLHQLEISKTELLIINVSNKVTPNNEPITIKDINDNLSRIRNVLEEYNPTHIIALGQIAARALKKLDTNYYVLPHPSPKNRKLNDKIFVEETLKECKEYLCM